MLGLHRFSFPRSGWIRTLPLFATSRNILQKYFFCTFIRWVQSRYVSNNIWYSMIKRGHKRKHFKNIKNQRWKEVTARNISQISQIKYVDQKSTQEKIFNKISIFNKVCVILSPWQPGKIDMYHMLSQLNKMTSLLWGVVVDNSGARKLVFFSYLNTITLCSVYMRFVYTWAGTSRIYSEYSEIWNR